MKLPPLDEEIEEFHVDDDGLLVARTAGGRLERYTPSASILAVVLNEFLRLERTLEARWGR